MATKAVTQMGSDARWWAQCRCTSGANNVTQIFAIELSVLPICMQSIVNNQLEQNDILSAFKRLDALILGLAGQ